MKNNYKLIGFLLCITIFAIIIYFLSNNKQSPEVFIYDIDDKMIVGNAILLRAEVKNREDSKIIWTSSNSNILEINQEGLLIAKNIGSATITAIYVDKDNKQYIKSIDIIVDGDNTILNNFSFKYSKIMMNIGNVYNLPLIIDGDKELLNKVNYVSSDISIISVSKDGTITALKYGTATISLNNYDNKTLDTIEILVSNNCDQPQLISDISSFKFDNLEQKVVKGETLKLEYSLEPSNADISDVVWNSTNEKIAIVKDGVVTGISEGKCIVNVKIDNNLEAYTVVEVIEKEVDIDEISLVPSSLLMKVGDISNIVASIKPSNSTDKTLKYSINNSSIAAVDASGKVTALKEGNAIITVSSNDLIEKKLIVNVVSEQIYNENIDNVSQNSENIVISLKSSSGTLRGSHNNVTETKGKITVGISSVIGINEIQRVEYCTYKYGESECNVFSQINDVNIDFYVIDNIGETVIRIKVVDKKNNVIYKNYYASIASVTSSNGNSGISDNDSYDTTGVHSSCGKKAQSLTGYVDGKQISYGEKFTISVGETLRIKLYLPTRCGTIKLLTRTTASGQDGWDTYLKGNSVPFVNRNDSSTFLARDNFEWVLVGKKNSNGRYIQLSETTFQKTSAFSEIKSFFEVSVKVVD